MLGLLGIYTVQCLIKFWSSKCVSRCFSGLSTKLDMSIGARLLQPLFDSYASRGVLAKKKLSFEEG